MPIDANIAMGVKPIELESPLNSLAKMLQVQDMQQSGQLNRMKMDEYGRGVERKNKLQSILSGEYENPESLQTAMRKGGFLTEANDYAKGNADIAKTKGEADYKQIETAHKRMDLMGQAFGFVKDNPTIENAFSAVDYLVSNGVMPAEAALASKQKLQGNPTPENIRALATQAFQSSLSAKDQLPKLGDFNGGSAQQFTSTDPVTGKVTNTGSMAITESANNVANNQRIAREGALNRGVQREGQDLTRERLAFDKTKPATPRATGPMSVTLQKELLESDDAVQTSNSVVSTLKNALKINDKAYSGYGAKARATLMSNVVGTESADATVDIDNMMTGQGLDQMKSIFGAAPTEGERKILMDMQASADKTPTQRKAIIDRAIAAAERRGKYADAKAKSIRAGTYLTEGVSTQAPAAGGGNEPAKVTNDSEYNALPPGSMFVGPDGKTRRKP